VSPVKRTLFPEDDEDNEDDEEIPELIPHAEMMEETQADSNESRPLSPHYESTPVPYEDDILIVRSVEDRESKSEDQSTTSEWEQKFNEWVHSPPGTKPPSNQSSESNARERDQRLADAVAQATQSQEQSIADMVTEARSQQDNSNKSNNNTLETPNESIPDDGNGLPLFDDQLVMHPSERTRRNTTRVTLSTKRPESMSQRRNQVLR